jgi:hypothetical protein
MQFFLKIAPSCFDNGTWRCGVILFFGTKKKV